jgi:hypothetical protein
MLATTSRARSARLLAVIAALLVVLVYRNALDNPFVYDDFHTVRDNLSLRDPIDGRAVVMGNLTRPVVNLSYAFDRAVWGPEPFGFHLTSVLLHMLNVLLLARFSWAAADDWNRGRGRRSAVGPLDPRAMSAITALFFAVHPMMTEAVGYISGRAEVLCAFFFLLAFLAARRWMLGGGASWLGASAVCWVVAVLSKEVAGTLPFVLFAYDRLVLDGPREARRRRWRYGYLPLMLAGVLAAATRLAVLAFVEHPDRLDFTWSFLLVEVDVLRRYLSLLVLPLGQTVFHAVNSPAGGVSGQAIFSLLWMTGAVVLARRYRRSQGLVVAGMAWMLLVLVPSGLLVALDKAEPMSERRIYLASCGFFLAVSALLVPLSSLLVARWAPARWLLRGAFALWLVVLSGLTVVRNTVWSSPVALWTEAMVLAPDIWVPHNMLAEALRSEGAREAALEHYRIAIELRPEEPRPRALLGACLLELGRYDEARDAFETLAALHPGSADAANGLGAWAFLTGDLPAARRHFERARLFDPANRSTDEWLARVAAAESSATSDGPAMPDGQPSAAGSGGAQLGSP